uniref:Receptor ligand binding region domain-containing protein n=1 Tax=Candidatus Methanophaga sp. ANME-1 ERB7 TaxID=2759913 RepID=A0A7G9Z5T8_9EURY|nr:hypothetical protein JLLEDACL_00021 [Methanosarcinales archaeon ANME-1 ERB7]
MAITAKTVAVIAVLLLVTGFTAGWFLRTPAPEVAPQPEVVLGALLPLTGALSSSGESTQAALELAVEDINEYLSSIGSKTSVRLIIEDTETDPAVALEKLQNLAGKGVKIVIGPDSSTEVEAVKTYANENNILLVSQSSTAPSLAIPGDNIFRFVPDDTHQAEAIALLMWEDGVRAVIPLWRGDVWGADLSEATEGSFEELGGTVIDGIMYSSTSEDFSAELESLSSKVSQAIAQYGDVNSVGVHLMAFEEVVPIFIQAQNDTVLSSVKWYGSDGTAMSNVLISNAHAAQFAVRLGFPNPIYGEKCGVVKEQIQEKIGRYPEADALAAYDALWVAAKTYLAAGGTTDTEALKKALRQEAEQYTGATGWTVLNEAGDRKVGNYDFWAVQEEDGFFQWGCVARYQVDPSSPGRLIYERKSSLVPALRVLVVHSYHEGWEWDQYIQKGIVEGLSRNGYILDRDYEMEEFYMDTKVTYTTPEQIEQRAEIALDIIAEFEPDIVFVNDDNALKYVAVEYTLKHPDKKLPFVFSGVNVDPTIYDPIKSLEMPGGPITGALERFSYYECFSLGKRIFPNASKIVLLADSSPSSTFVVEAFKERYLEKIVDSPLQVIGPIQVETFKEWKAKVAEYQTKADFIGILTYHQLRAENGEVVSAPEVVNWAIHNSKLPELGVLTFHAEDGFLAAAGVSGYKTGIYVGVIGGEILEGSNPATIPIVDPKVVDIAFNLERAEMLGIEIPATELVEATEVFHSS